MSCLLSSLIYDIFRFRLHLSMLVSVYGGNVRLHPSMLGSVYGGNGKILTC